MILVAGLALLPGAAVAGDASLYTLTESGRGYNFTATLNQLPVGPPGFPAESLVLSLDEFLRPGDNTLVVTLDRIGTGASAGVTVLGPSPNALGFGDQPHLAQYVCEAVAHDALPACPAHYEVRATLTRPNAPDLRAWHAEAPPPGTDPAAAIADALDLLTTQLAEAARGGDWAKLYYLTDIRRADMLRANPAAREDAAAMARYMAQAAAGQPVVQAAPDAAALIVVPVGQSLWSVRRRDGDPIIRITVGSGSDDPDTLGDVADRYAGGEVARRVAVFGRFDGRWQLVR